MTPLQIADASFVFRQFLFMLIDLLVLFVVMAPNPFVALPAVLFLFLDIRPELLHYRRQRCNRAGQKRPQKAQSKIHRPAGASAGPEAVIRLLRTR